MKLNIDSFAPKITTKEHKDILRSTDNLGLKSLISFFYLRNNSPIRTSQFCFFKDNYNTFKVLKIQVGGTNNERDVSHLNFSKNLNITLPFISDKNNPIREDYGIFNQLFLYLNRITFVIYQEKEIKLTYKNLINLN